MDPRVEIEELVAIGARGPGTDAERRTAQHLRRRLGALGREIEVEPTVIRPRWALALTACTVLGVVASIAATAAPLAGAILAGVALVALVAELSGRLPVARLLTPRRASQNVLSREDGGRPGTLVLVAHYDAAPTGMVYGEIAGARARLGRLLRRGIGPFEPIVWALVVVLACSVLWAVGIDPTAVAIVQFAATVALILAIPLLADIALSDVGPGASDNASGVATVLRLAERYGDDLDHFDVWVLFTGGEEALAEGMRAWMRRHRRELEPTATVFLNVDTVGSGTVRYARRIGPVLTAGLHPRVLELCDQIAEEDAAEGQYRARPIVVRAIDDALAARRARFPAASISCRDENDHPPELHRDTDTPERVEDEALERAFGFCSELVELIDEEIGPEVADRRERERVAGGG